jgi:hypothetical protein
VIKFTDGTAIQITTGHKTEAYVVAIRLGEKA